MREINDPRAWVNKAEEDFTLAQSALRRKKPLITGACFHIWQKVSGNMNIAITLQAGEYRELPAHAWQSFFPEVQGTSAGAVFEIKP